MPNPRSRDRRLWGREAIRRKLQGLDPIPRPKLYTPTEEDRRIRYEELQQVFAEDMRKRHRMTFEYSLPHGKKVVATMAPEKNLQEVIRGTTVRVAWSYTGGARVIVYPELL